MKKRVIKIPLALPVFIIVICVIIATVFLGKELISNSARYTATNTSIAEDGNYEYEVLEDGTIAITAYLGKDSFVTIPNTIDGKAVTCIRNSAFLYCLNLKSVEIQNGIKEIEESAFIICMNLIKIEIPESVTSIEPCAFIYCNNLKNINVSSNNTVFMSENGILFNKEKTEIIQYPLGKENSEYTIPEGITVIGNGAFSSAQNLQIINIPEGVTSIGYGAFEECNNLTSIKIPESVTEIGNCALSNCRNLTNIELPQNEMETKDATFSKTEIVKAINTENYTTYEIEIPNVMKRAMDESDQLYASEGFELTNCEISEDKTKLVVNVEMMKEENTASIYVKNGKLEGLSMEIVPSGTVTYNDEEEFLPYKRRVNAILHLAEGEQITNNEGKNIYTFTKDGEFTFEYTDANGNVKTSEALVDWMWDCTVLANFALMLDENNENDEYIIADIQPKTTISQLKTIMKLDETQIIKVRSNEKEELSETDFIGTDMQLVFMNEDRTESEHTYTLLVRGDTNGDGKADFKDLTKINSYRLNKKSLEDRHLVASDVNDDGIVDFKDLVKINKLRLNKITEL